MQQPKLAIISGYYSPNKNFTRPRWLKSVIQNHQNYCNRHGYRYFFRDDFVKPVSTTNALDPFYVGAWSKPQFIKDLINKDFDYVFWIDSDSIFTNFNIGFNDLISKNRDLVFTGDCYDICNSGHLLVKNTEFTRKFLNLWDESRKINCSEINANHLGFEITKDGYSRSDQTNINALLCGPINSSIDLSNYFNKSNGYHGNSSRLFHDWQNLFTPSSEGNIKNIFSKLIDPAIGDHIHITKQKRLNAYVSKIENCEVYQFGDPIVHFVSNTKKYLLNMGWIENELMKRGIYITPFLWHYPRKTLKRWLKKLF